VGERGRGRGGGKPKGSRRVREVGKRFGAHVRTPARYAHRAVRHARAARPRPTFTRNRMSLASRRQQARLVPHVAVQLNMLPFRQHVRHCSTGEVRTLNRRPPGLQRVRRSRCPRYGALSGESARPGSALRKGSAAGGGEAGSSVAVRRARSGIWRIGNGEAPGAEACRCRSAAANGRHTVPSVNRPRRWCVCQRRVRRAFSRKYVASGREAAP